MSEPNPLPGHAAVSLRRHADDHDAELDAIFDSLRQARLRKRAALPPTRAWRWLGALRAAWRRHTGR